MSSYGCLITDGRYSCPGDRLAEKRLNRHAGHVESPTTTEGQLNRLVAGSESLFDTAGAVTLAAFWGIGKATAGPAFDSIARRFSNRALANTSGYLGLGMAPAIDMLAGLSVYIGEGDLSELGSLALAPIKDLAVAPERVMAGEYVEGISDAAIGLSIGVGAIYGAAAGAGAVINTAGRVGGAVAATATARGELALAGGGRVSSSSVDFRCLEVAALREVTQPIPKTVPGYIPPSQPSQGTPTRPHPRGETLPPRTIFPRQLSPAERALMLSERAGTEVVVIRDGKHLAEFLGGAKQGQSMSYVYVELDAPLVKGVRPRELRIVPDAEPLFLDRKIVRPCEPVVAAGKMQREFPSSIKFDGGSNDFSTGHDGVSSKVSNISPADKAGRFEFLLDVRALLGDSGLHVRADY